MTTTQATAGPNGMSAVTPHLVCAGAANAIEFYKNAFGAEEKSRLAGPDGKIMNAMITIGGAAIMLVDEMPQWGVLGPKAINGTPVTIHLNVKDADAAAAQAVKAGAKVIMPVCDQFWGDRYGALEDPYGHKWSVGQHLRDMTPDEIREGMMKAMPPQKN
jgi:PhnB protein